MNASEIIERLQALVAEHGDFPVSITAPADQEWEDGKPTLHYLDNAFCEVAPGMKVMCLWPTGSVSEHELRKEFNLAQGAAKHDDDHNQRKQGTTGYYTQIPNGEWIQEAIASGDIERLKAVHACLHKGSSAESFRVRYAINLLENPDEGTQ